MLGYLVFVMVLLLLPPPRLAPGRLGVLGKFQPALSFSFGIEVFTVGPSSVAAGIVPDGNNQPHGVPLAADSRDDFLVGAARLVCLFCFHGLNIAKHLTNAKRFARVRP